ncbi:2-dehydro-3-deoxygalactonokinase [Salipiger abyssi]|uniref:2-keto-3-deoxygalactonate kinase n=1 Tax=Salipiger abyssi TaxID=1250539 RepID=A0A1P8UWA7_9RHOB|nr:2-dehydro-3-deoxygalactonokinase [Salipiger abyssi]APZ53675.1 2-keto-3-deoxygalactonate kinase [Salipiger abyssi]
MTQPDWIAAEWGAAHLRIWQIGAEGRVLSTAESGEGYEQTDAPGPALRRLLPDLDASVPVLMSGAGLLPSPAVPCTPPVAAQAREEDGLRLLPGVAQETPADLLRGEEVRVAGFLAMNPRFDGVVCLPGAQSRWVHVSAGEIVSFRSFLTGTLFAGLPRLAAPEAGWDEAALVEAADRAMGRPAGIAGDLAAVLAEMRLKGLPAGAASSQALGLLIGLELAAAKPYWLGQNVALVGEGALVAPYRAALAAQHVPVVQADGARMALEGLKVAWRG